MPHTAPKHMSHTIQIKAIIAAPRCTPNTRDCNCDLTYYYTVDRQAEIRITDENYDCYFSSVMSGVKFPLHKESAFLEYWAGKQSLKKGGEWINQKECIEIICDKHRMFNHGLPLDIRVDSIDDIDTSETLVRFSHSGRVNPWVPMDVVWMSYRKGNTQAKEAETRFFKLLKIKRMSPHERYQQWDSIRATLASFDVMPIKYSCEHTHCAGLSSAAWTDWHAKKNRHLLAWVHAQNICDQWGRSPTQKNTISEVLSFKKALAEKTQTVAADIERVIRRAIRHNRISTKAVRMYFKVNSAMKNLSQWAAKTFKSTPTHRTAA